MATTNFYLKTKDKKSGLSLILLYFRFDDQTLVVSTKEKINPDHWDSEKQTVRTKFKSKYPRVKDALEDMASVLESVFRRMHINGETRTPETVKEKFNQEYWNKSEATKKITLFEYCQSYIKKAEIIKEPGTIFTYKNTVRILKEFEAERKYKVNFDTINLDFLAEFTEYLFEQGKKLNSVNKEIKILKTFLNAATDEGVNTKLDFKSKRFSVPKEDPDNIYLTKEEIQKIYDLDLSNNPDLDEVRDCFIIGIETGLRYGDLLKLTRDYIKNGFICLRTKKTDTPIAIGITNRIEAVLKKYEHKRTGFPYFLANPNMNKNLKVLGEMAGLDSPEVIRHKKGNYTVETTHPKYSLIKTHTMRRTYITNLLLEGVAAAHIMKSSGHRSLKVFQNYLKMTAEESAMKILEHQNRANSPLTIVA